jgi:hypothetical protein
MRLTPLLLLFSLLFFLSLLVPSASCAPHPARPSRAPRQAAREAERARAAEQARQAAVQRALARRELRRMNRLDPVTLSPIGQPLPKPDDPRYVMDAKHAGWQRAPDAPKGIVYSKRRGLWFRTPARKEAWVAGRWVPTSEVTSQFLLLNYLHDPHMHLVNGKWKAYKHLGVRSWAMDSMGWWRLARKGKDRHTMFFNGRWRPAREVYASDPRWFRTDGKWVYAASKLLNLKLPYHFRDGRWFRSRYSSKIYGNYRWHDLRNNPNWIPSGLSRGSWTKARVTPGMKPRYFRYKGLWYDSPRRHLVYINRRWVDANNYLVGLRLRRAHRRFLRGGPLTPDLREAISDAIKVKFARFTKWFVKSYLMGGNFSAPLTGPTVKYNPAALTPETDPNRVGEAVVRGVGSGIPMALLKESKQAVLRQQMVQTPRHDTTFELRSSANAALEVAATKEKQEAAPVEDVQVDGLEGGDAPPPNLPVAAAADPTLAASEDDKAPAVVTSVDPTLAHAKDNNEDKDEEGKDSGAEVGYEDATAELESKQESKKLFSELH